MHDVRSRFPLHGLLQRWRTLKTPRLARWGQRTTMPEERFRAERLLRWYLLLWVCLVYLWGCSEVWTWGEGVTANWDSCLAHQAVPQLCAKLRLQQHTPWWIAAPSSSLLAVLLPSLVAFTVLLVLYGTLLWRGLAGKSQRQFTWLLLLVQGMLVLAIGAVVPQISGMVMLSLYLALILEAFSMLRQVHVAIAIGCGALLLGMLALSLIWKQSDVAWATYPIAGMAVALILFVIGFLMVYMRLVRAHEHLVAAHAQLAVSAERIETLTLLTERQRLARELHDTLAQGVVGLTLQLETVDALLTEEHPKQAQEIVQQAMQRARATLATARGAIDDLRSAPPNERTFREAVQGEIQRFTTTAGIPCRAELMALPLFPPPLQEQLLRVIGEGLANVARHAQAHSAWVRMFQEQTTLTVEVGDDGIGFDPTATTTLVGRYGLLGLGERACLLGGHLEIQSATGEGTVLRFSIPHMSEESKEHCVKAAVLPADEGMREEARDE
jgi:two-component system, NarL family, sensor histidine kinase YdfH